MNCTLLFVPQPTYFHMSILILSLCLFFLVFLLSIVYMFTHNYIINFVDGLFPLASEAHCGYTSLHKYVITITV